MLNENLLIVVVLYVNACPVGILNRLGFFVSEANSSCTFFIERGDIVKIPYHIKSENKESIRFYVVPYTVRQKYIQIDEIIKYCERIEPAFESLSFEVILQRRKEASLKNAQIIKDLEERQNIERVKESLRREKYKNWWLRSESENVTFGLYNGD